MKLGKAKFGGGTKKQYFKLKEGESVFRILPPMGELADEGRWSVFYNVHYGYANAEGKSRPFQSPEVKNRKTKMIEIPDAANERLAKLKAELQKAKDSKNKQQTEALLKLVGGMKSRYNLDSNHYLNVIDEQGNIGVLKLRHRAKTALDATIKELRDKNIDPLSVDNGRFFSFRRTGMGLDTTFQVTVKKQKMMVEVAGEKMEVERDLVHTLSDEMISRLSSEAAELNKLFRRPTAEEVAQIVSESNLATGVSPNIDSILKFNSKGSTASAAQEEEVYEDGPDEDEVQQTAPVTPKATAAPAATSKPVQKASAPAPAPVASSAVSDMSEDEFLSSLGLK